MACVKRLKILKKEPIYNLIKRNNSVSGLDILQKYSKWKGVINVTCGQEEKQDRARKIWIERIDELGKKINNTLSKWNRKK